MSQWECEDCGAIAFFGVAAPEVCPFCATEEEDVDEPEHGTEAKP